MSRAGRSQAARLRRGLTAALLCAVAAWLAGCAGHGTASPDAITGTALRGSVRGGQQPVSGATLSLYVAGTGGNGQGASSLLVRPVLTDGNGDFSITGDYLCPTPSAPVYLVARGGNPGLAPGTNNSALVLLTALGPCGALSASTNIVVNEATTVAAAWALSPFFGADAAIGASPTNNTGLRNAFAVAAELANPANGAAPGATLPAGAVTETAKLNTLADALAPCVNSAGGAPCTALFQAASSSGGPTPANTLDAALGIVRQPGTNTASVFGLVPAQSPFQPVLPTAPNDWTMTITVAGAGLNLPAALAVDSSGDAWVANGAGGVVSELLAGGAAAAANGFAGAGLHSSFGVAVDPLGNVWISNENSVTAAGNGYGGSLSKFSQSGAELSGAGFTGGGIYYPQGIASDRAGNIWVADYGSSSASLFGNAGTPLSPTSGFGTSQLPFTTGVALDSTGNAWFAAEGAAVRVSPAGAVTQFPCCTDPIGVAVDQAGNVWLADYGGAAVVELSSSGVLLAQVQSLNGSAAPQAVAIDGAGAVFAANFRGNSLTELTGTGTAVSLRSPAAGFGLDAPLNEPLGLALDASGNVWVSNYGGDTVTIFVGLGTPIRTPLTGPPATP